MPKRKRLKRKKKTFTYHVGFPPYARIKHVNGFSVSSTPLATFGAKVTVRNGHMQKVVRGK